MRIKLYGLSFLIVTAGKYDSNNFRLFETILPRSMPLRLIAHKITTLDVVGGLSA